MTKSNSDVNWMQIATGKRFDSWCGYAFENLCFKHLEQIKRALGIAGIQSRAGTWRHQSGGNDPGAQIDLLIERADRCFNLIEAKYSSNPYVITKAYAGELENKIRVFRERTKVTKPIFLTMVTPHGVAPNRHAAGLSLAELTVSDLMT